MKSPEGGSMKENICEEFRRHGYNLRCFEINAKDFGVPQHRERVLFIALRSELGLMPTLPERTHGDEPGMFSKTFPYRTFADACSDLPFIESGGRSDDPLHVAVEHPAHVIEWLWDVQEGRSAHDNVEPRKRPPSGYNTTYKRQVWKEPAATVQTTFGMISGCRNVHPIATRSLTIREAARIQSFPDSFRFAGSLGSIRTGIGNAVPPLLSHEIALHAIKVLGKLIKVTGL
jgi:DNA (cytosine-5)-methyltransferase 1